MSNRKPKEPLIVDNGIAFIGYLSDDLETPVKTGKPDDKSLVWYHYTIGSMNTLYNDIKIDSRV